MRKTLKAKEEFFYGGKTHKVGDHFEAVDPDANILVVTNKAEEVAPEQKAAMKTVAPKLETADLTAEKEKPAPEVMTTENSGGLSSARSRRYLRRDMKAKE